MDLQTRLNEFLKWCETHSDQLMKMSDYGLESNGIPIAEVIKTEGNDEHDENEVIFSFDV